jgi:scyllo-inositol 2-dehydrogenase (NADP+)
VTQFNKPAEIKVGVIGYGGAFNMGKLHLTQMQTAGMTPTAIAEIDPKRLEVAQVDFPGIETYSTVSEMLAKSDVHLLAVITPHNTHADLAIQCLNAGRHVVTEKPFAITTAECDAMIAAAKENGVVVSTYHNRHWDGCVLEAVRQIRSGVIGEVFRIEAHMANYAQPRDWWRSSKSISGGILYDWGVHLLEYALQIIDSEMCEVTGFAKTGFWADKTPWGADTNEDEGFGVVRFTNGKWLTLRISSIDSHPQSRWLEITGTRGTYLFDHGTYEIIKHEEGKTHIVRGANPASEGQKFYDNIADHLTKGTPLVITPEWARRPIHILDLMNQSAAQGRALQTTYR